MEILYPVHENVYANIWLFLIEIKIKVYDRLNTKINGLFYDETIVCAYTSG